MLSEGSDPGNPPKQTFELNLLKKKRARECRGGGGGGGVGRVWRQAARDRGNPTWWLGRSRHVKRIYRTIIVYFLTASGRLKRYRLHFTCLLLRLEYSTMKICSNICSRLFISLTFSFTFLNFLAFKHVECRLKRFKRPAAVIKTDYSFSIYLRTYLTIRLHTYSLSNTYMYISNSSTANHGKRS